MTREIKFRVWDNAMIYDNFLSLHANPAFVMQYTGLQDKNGKEIYEGDIIYSELNCLWLCGVKCDYLGLVEFGDYSQDGTDSHTGFYIKLLYKDVGISEGYIEYYEVIGNIYENPELLEE